MRRLNVVFAVSAVLTLVVMLWMLWHDYRRPWREMQNEFFDLRSGMAHFKLLAYEGDEAKAEHAALRAAVEEARAELEAPSVQKELEQLNQEEQQLDGEMQAVQITFGNRNAELQVLLFNHEEHHTLHGPDDPKTIEVKETYESQKETVQRLARQADTYRDRLDAIKREKKAIFARLDEAERALQAYEKGIADARRMEKMYSPKPLLGDALPLARNPFNLPGLDFVAPKGTPGRQEIRQVFMNDIRADYNFAESYITDRCITCHVAIDDPAMTRENFVEQAEQALTVERVKAVVREENARLIRQYEDFMAAAPELREFTDKDVSEMSPDERSRFVDVVIEAANAYLQEIDRPHLPEAKLLKADILGRDEVTRQSVMRAVDVAFQRVLSAVRPAGPDGVPLPWEDMSIEQQMAYVGSLNAAVNMYLTSVGRPTITLEQPLLAHPNLDLYVTPESPHAMNQMGCTVCHEGSGQETDFVLAAHTPKNKAEKKEWKEKYYVRELGVPLATFHLVEEFWERPMLQPGYTSASCVKCHDQVYDLERSKARRMMSSAKTDRLDGGEKRINTPLRIVEGRHLFTSLGCINCHNVEGLTDSRRVGTDLYHVADKLTPGFMQRWIDYPNNFRPSTRMPHFFHQENNLPGSANEFDPNPVLRTETEVQAITRYLQTFSRPAETHPLPEGIEGDPARGAELFTSIGCLACHANLDAIDPNDDANRSFGEVWITQDLMHDRDIPAEQAKSIYDGMSKSDRVRYASQELTPDRRRRHQETAEEERIEADLEGRDPDPEKLYVPAAFTRFAPELSGMGTKLVPDPGDEHQARRAKAWLYNWLREPRHYASYTNMPRMFRENYHWELDEAGRWQQNDQDMMDVAAYLLSLRNDEFPTEPFSNDEAHATERERLILMLLTGQNTESVANKILNDEKAFGDEPYGMLTGNIVSAVSDSFGGGEVGQRKTLALLEAHAGTLAERQQVWLGQKMIGHYGCYSCHRIAGFETATRPGTDLTLWAQKFMSQIDFAFYSPPFEHEIEADEETFGHIFRPEGQYAHLVRDTGENPPVEMTHNHAGFAYHKFRNPRIYDRAKIKKPYEKLKMPNFFLNEEETRALVTYMLGRRDKNVRGEVQVAYDGTVAGKLARGRVLAREMNCVGCHTIEGGEANIHQYYLDDPALGDTYPFGVRFQPPSLWGEGAKIQHPWLFSFLNNVEMLRPWLNVRMPSFYWTTDDAEAIVAYFAGASQYEAEMLDDALLPIIKYMQQVHAPPPTTELTGTNGNEGADAALSSWFIQDKLRDERRLLEHYALANRQIRPFELDTGGETNPAEVASMLAPTLDKIVNRAAFLSSTFDVAYPFSDADPHFATEQRFALGEAFFYELKCLACHVAGDPSVPGTTTDIKAPNFALTHKRLRYDWVMKWLQDPQALQPGTNMPQIFIGGKSYFSIFPEEVRAEKEDKYGATMQEQGSLLIDFLFTLGESGYTAIQPGADQVEAVDEAEDVEFDFDSGGDDEEDVEFDFE